ncbi:hypothetical protein DFA_00073 [Cavenderia fasciculata]|uniref:Uncharacterized protein n=1 Tax=Cavenderia fasciculata TaxID=261658 RepID=F4PXI6_CACFS|nr:uncharacterized protein DFA_00073 [Cavenderia fasciculata]EGG19496.1 hypothetical protein DFA_00073 [Cavenderia fasciculata]|eukprot:XP_004357790.1 hypothetical protein DFA_00073 [Cavenderia fasciculata]
MDTVIPTLLLPGYDTDNLLEHKLCRIIIDQDAIGRAWIVSNTGAADSRDNLVGVGGKKDTATTSAGMLLSVCLSRQARQTDRQAYIQSIQSIVENSSLANPLCK